MHNVMVDLETFGRKSGCAIAAIGAVAFDMDKGLGNKFYVTIRHPVGTVDMDTILWWMKQSDAARAALSAKGAIPHEEALKKFYEFFMKEKARYLWCNGASFDEPILRGAAGGIPVPWSYKDVRCARTLAMLGGVGADYKEDEHHNALWDAVRQAEQAIKCLQRIKLVKGKK